MPCGQVLKPPRASINPARVLIREPEESINTRGVYDNTIVHG